MGETGSRTKKQPARIEPILWGSVHDDDGNWCINPDAAEEMRPSFYGADVKYLANMAKTPSYAFWSTTEQPPVRAHNARLVRLLSEVNEVPRKATALWVRKILRLVPLPPTGLDFGETKPLAEQLVNEGYGDLFCVLSIILLRSRYMQRQLEQYVTAEDAEEITRAILIDPVNQPEPWDPNFGQRLAALRAHSNYMRKRREPIMELTLQMELVSQVAAASGYATSMYLLLFERWLVMRLHA